MIDIALYQLEQLGTIYYGSKKEYLLNPTKFQKLEDCRENQNQVFNFAKTNRENKIKKSKQAYWLNYNKAAIL